MIATDEATMTGTVDTEAAYPMAMLGGLKPAVPSSPGVTVMNEPCVDPELLQKTMCLAVSLRMWGTRRKVDPDEIDVEADKRLIHVSKEILDSPEMKKIRHHMSQVRAYLQRMSLPSQVLRRGLHLVSVATIEEIDAELVTARTVLNQLADDLIAVYPEQKAKARIRLNGLFRESDYPTPEALRELFGIEEDYVELRVPDQLARVSQVIYERQLKKQQEQLVQMFEEVRQGLRVGLQELVEHLVNRLQPDRDGKPKVFRSTTVEHMYEFLSVFDAKNITDDLQLKELVEKAREVMNGVGPDALRKDQGVRETVREGLSQVKQNLERLIHVAPGRRLKLD